MQLKVLRFTLVSESKQDFISVNTFVIIGSPCQYLDDPQMRRIKMFSFFCNCLDARSIYGNTKGNNLRCTLYLQSPQTVYVTYSHQGRQRIHNKQTDF